MIINFASNSFSLFLEIPALLHLAMHIVIIARYFVISFFFFFFFERERLFLRERWREFLGLIVGTMSESCSFFWEYEKLISIVRNS